jgi:transcriptional regulator with XRE-family HTH domain
MRLDLKHLQRVETGATNVTLVTLLRIADAFGEPFVLPSIAALPAVTMPLSENAVRLPLAMEPALSDRAGRDPDDVVRDVGRRIAEVRTHRGLTQRQLARASGVPASVVQRVEEGRFRGVALRAVARLAAALAATVDELLAPPTAPRRGRGRPPRPSPQ